MYLHITLFHIIDIHLDHKQCLSYLCRYKSEHNQAVVASLADQLSTFRAADQGAASIKGNLARSCY